MQDKAPKKYIIFNEEERDKDSLSYETHSTETVGDTEVTIESSKNEEISKERVEDDDYESNADTDNSDNEDDLGMKVDDFSK